MVAQAACLVEGSSQHHCYCYYHHRRGGHFQYYRRIYFYSFQWRGVEMSCGSTGCLSCRGKQSTSLSLSSLGLSYPWCTGCLVPVLFGAGRERK